MIKAITTLLILLLVGCAEEERSKHKVATTTFDLRNSDTLTNSCGDTVFQSFNY